MWWSLVRERYSHIKRLVIYLDNGPNNNGRRTQLLKRMVQFADWSGLSRTGRGCRFTWFSIPRITANTIR